MNHEDTTREELFAGPEEVVTFAQAYYATESPNGERRGCPTADGLRAAARSGSLPDAGLRHHLFNCSECFRSYRSVRMGYRPRAAGGQSWRADVRAAFSSFTLRHAALAVGSLCLLLFGFMAVALMRHEREGTPPVALKNSRAETALSPTPSLIPRTAAPITTPTSQAVSASVTTQSNRQRRPKAEARSSRTSPALPIVEINLNEEGLLRDGDEPLATRRVINLSRKRQRLRLRMPEGSGGGHYTVTIVDAFGKPLVTSTADSNGRTLTVDLDLQRLDAKKYRLCTARGGEAPDCYLIAVNERTRLTGR